MHRLTRALILCPLLLLPAAGAAQASPIFVQALTDGELAANRAGTAITLQLQEDAQNNTLLPVAMGALPPSLFGIQTLVLDTGTASVSQAATMVTVKATLNGTGF